jgi:hypothetical protein
LASDNRGLLGQSYVFSDTGSLEGAIKQAKEIVDECLGGAKDGRAVLP